MTYCQQNLVNLVLVGRVVGLKLALACELPQVVG